MNSYLEALNEQQREAVLHTGNPLLILAGAGSGKTRVITTKIAYLIDQCGADPRSILAVTFTNKAAREMYERVILLSPGAEGVMIRTFHSFGAWLLRRNTHCINLKSNFTIYDDEDMLTLLHSLYPEKKRNDCKPFAHWISRAKDYALRPGDNLEEISWEPDFPEIYETYQKRLDEIGCADFGDLILKSVELLRDNPEVKNRVQQRFNVILVDEYQDSNVAQFELLKQLKGENTYLCVVGDDDQSIYRFRGAEVRNILEFPDFFRDTRIIKLERNYRSTKNILSIASAVVEKNSGRLGKTLWTEKEGGKKACLKILENQNQEAEYCAQLLSDRNYGDTAILYRTNAQSLAFESLFLRLGIPYRIVGALRFYEREEIKDAIALMNFFVNPYDEVAFRRIINKPPRGLGKKSIAIILNHSYRVQGNLEKACENAVDDMPKKGRESLSAVASCLKKAGTILGTVALPDFIEELLKDFGIAEYHRKQDEITGTQKILNLQELLNAASDYENSFEGLKEFLENIELDRAQFLEQQEDGRDRVTLITMHNTKGLEFRRVMITGLDDGLFPSLRDGIEDELEEERRIFYVSITRAQEELYLTSCRMRRIWGKTIPFQPSRFIFEIPEELLVVEGNPGTDFDSFARGTRIYHDEYGYGTVIQEEQKGRDQIIAVHFDNGFTANFIPRYTPLQKISKYDEE